MELLPLAFTSSWSSGVNASGSVLIAAGVLVIPVLSRPRRGWRRLRRWLGTRRAAAA